VQIHIGPNVKAQTKIAPLASNSPAIIAFPTDDQIKAAKHREIARHYARPRRKRSRPGIVSLILRDLHKFFDDKYGDTFPDDDAGRGDLVVLLQYMAQLGDPRAMTACADRWCPWLTNVEYTAMIAGIERAPMRWRADALASEIGLNRATRTRLGITTIGAVDFGKGKRTSRRKKRNTASKRARRAATGAKPHAASVERTKPWITLGISRRTYYRKQANGTVGTETGTAARIYMGKKNQCHTEGASPQGESAAVAGLVLNPAITAAFLSELGAAAETGRDSADAGRLCFRWRKKGKNPFESIPPATLESTEMGRAAA
jgi:hypothetical protein